MQADEEDTDTDRVQKMFELMSVKQDLDREGRTCKILEAEVKELRGEPQASTRGLTGVQCGRGEGCNAMSQQNLEEEVGCGQTD